MAKTTKTNADPTPWQNRIIGEGEVAAVDLVPHPQNWRKHPAGQGAVLGQTLDGVGWVQRVIVNRRTGRMLDGHLRAELARRQGEQTPVPVVYVDLSEDEERTILATLDPIAGMAIADEATLAGLVRSIEDADLRSVAGTIAQSLNVDVDGKGDAGKDTEPQIDRAEELRGKWGVEAGQLWKLGEHRLICGDCTDAAVVARVMGGERAEMVWTDPPYGVAVGDKNKFLNSIARSNRIEENLTNDTLDETGLMAMLCAAFDNAIRHCTAGAAWYVAAPAVPLHVLFGQALKDRGIWRQTLQWVKNNATFSPMGVCYHWRAEPIFFGWLPNGGHRWYGGRTQTTVWEIDRPMASPEHPTMKPVALVARAIENSSRFNDIVYDPFLGSGTTLIACENLSRRCRAVEISPGYVAVALERWATHTGKTPVLLNE